MKLYPESAWLQLEFGKVKALLAAYCQTDHARTRTEQLRIHTRKEFIDTELRQSHEYRQLIQNSIYFPNDYILNVSKELKLLSIPGALLAGDQLLLFRKLAESMEKIFRWFDGMPIHAMRAMFFRLAFIGMIGTNGRLGRFRD